MKRTSLGWLGLFIAASLAPAGAKPHPGGAMNDYRRAHTLFEAGHGADAFRAMARGLSKPLGGGTAANRDLLLHLSRANVRYGLAMARQGKRHPAVRSALAGQALSRQTMVRPGALCADIRSGVTLWQDAAVEMEAVWRRLGQQRRAGTVMNQERHMMRFAKSVILPRSRRAERRADQRAESAEARALVRLWEHELVRSACLTSG